MAKGTKRKRALATKRANKIANAKNGGTSKYAAKKAQSNFTVASPFFVNPADPTHETVDDARKREYEERQQRFREEGRA